MVGYVYRRAVGGCVCVVWVGRKYAELNLSDWWLEINGCGKYKQCELEHILNSLWILNKTFRAIQIFFK